MLYCFIETHFLINENPYRRSLSLHRHTYEVFQNMENFVESLYLQGVDVDII